MTALKSHWLTFFVFRSIVIQGDGFFVFLFVSVFDNCILYAWVDTVTLIFILWALCKGGVINYEDVRVALGGDDQKASSHVGWCIGCCINNK